jgi:4-amino-4-deoxy-L-arabinose transferase-like glycosyltransferase
MSHTHSTAANHITRHRLFALLVLVVVGLSAVAFIRRLCLNDPGITFLTAAPPAEWILLPTPCDLGVKRMEERRSRFRTTFDLPARPRSGAVQIRALRDYTLRVNGERIGAPADQKFRWKDVRRHDVTAALRSGRNDIEVEVSCTGAPPALWLTLRADGLVVKTGRHWQARVEGGAWTPVRLAVEPMEHPIARTCPTVREGWRDAWPAVLAWVAVSLMLVGAGLWWTSRRRAEPDPSVDRPSIGQTGRHAELALLGLIVVLWIVLCANNLWRLPPILGYDAPAHYEYFKFLHERHRLPLASDGWEMYQPPLYYVLGACMIGIGRSAGWITADALAPKLLSAVSGLGLIIMVWLVLRLMFPDSRRARCAGLLLASAMPMNLYMSQYPTNEVLSAALVAAALALALRIVRDVSTSPVRWGILGAVLGLGLLTKHTAFLAVVMVFVVLAGHVLRRHGRLCRVWSATVLTALAALMIVAGWLSLRNWLRFGNPFVGNWDPGSGFVYWQDPGYTTSAYLLRFGRSLTEPFHSCLYSFPDAIYSTVWGDGTWAGIAGGFRPPWHFSLMAVGYPLALYPTALIGLGLVLAIVHWIRRPTAQWALLVGHGLIMGLAVLYMGVKLPYYSVMKGFFGLSAMPCICALGALGFDCVARRLGRARPVMWVPMLVWAVNAYASFFVWPLDARTHMNLGKVFAAEGVPGRAATHFRRAAEMDPTLSDAFVQAGRALIGLVRHGDAEAVLKDGLDHHPGDLEMVNNLAWLLATSPQAGARNGEEALRLARRACEATRDEDASVLDTLAAAQAETGDFAAASRTLRRAIQRAESTGRRDLLDGLRRRLAMYESARPFRLPGR